MAANLASQTNFPKRQFWRVLEFDKFAVEWPLLKMDPLSSFFQLILRACNYTINKPPSTKHGTFGAEKAKTC